MTGISEILVLILLITGILIIPRMFKPAPQKSSAKKAKPMTAKMRAGIVLSVLIPSISALMFKPWKSDIILFLSTGVLPVALAWGLFWIFSAQKK